MGYCLDDLNKSSYQNVSNEFDSKNGQEQSFCF